MKNKFLLTSFLFVFLLAGIFSCKKKEKAPEPAPATTTYANNYDGLLYSQEMASVYSGTIMFTSGSGQAVFPTQGFYNSSSFSDGFVGTGLYCGTVSVNSVSFKPQNQTSGITYDDTTSTLFSSPLAWSVSGGNGIPAFTYTYTDARPAYTGWASLQDTIKLAQNTVINLNGVSGADEISVFIMGGSSGYVSKVIPGTASTVSFSTSELSALSPSSSSYIWITCTKASIASIGDKKFKFKIGYSIFKTIVTQ